MITGTINEILSQKRSQPLWTISPDATVFDAIQMMAEKNIGALPVMNGSRLLGTISERDYTRKVAIKGRSSRDTVVREILSSPVTATPAHAIEDCMRLMTEHRVRHLPIVDGDRLVGLVSIGDLVNWIISAQSVALNQLESYITGH
jgi:CBS domain-containing protein